MSDSHLDVVERCSECGRRRTHLDGGYCEGVMTLAEHPPALWEVVEVVPKISYLRAVDALRDAWDYLAHDEADAAQVVIERACEVLGVGPSTPST